MNRGLKSTKYYIPIIGMEGDYYTHHGEIIKVDCDGHKADHCCAC